MQLLRPSCMSGMPFTYSSAALIPPGAICQEARHLRILNTPADLRRAASTTWPCDVSEGVYCKTSTVLFDDVQSVAAKINEPQSTCKNVRNVTAQGGEN